MSRTNTSINDRKDNYLEPRVAKLEEGMARLTDDIKDLAIIVRTQSTQVEQEIQKLVVAVTQAAGPRKTDWSTVFAGIMLVLAIGSAVFWPLNETSQENKLAVQQVQLQINDHAKLPIHPIGEVLVEHLEERLKTHEVWAEKEKTAMLEKIAKEQELIQKYLTGELGALQDKHTISVNKLADRVLVLEAKEQERVQADRNELIDWRKNAMISPKSIDASTSK